MKAVALTIFGGPEVLTVQEVPLPVPGPEEVRIRVRATALNRADLLEREGRYPPPGKRPTHQIPGLEVSGIVDQIGERVSMFAPGDRVMALLSGGGYAEYVVANERMTMAVPAHMELEHAAAIPEAYLTAFDSLYEQGAAYPSAGVLIHAGASGVGSAAIQLAKQANMSVITTVGSVEKANRVRALGADCVVNYHESSFVSVVKEWTHQKGVPVILDFVGQQYFEDNLRCLSPDGTIVLIGTLSGNQASIDLGLVLARRLRIQGTALRSRPLERKISLVQRFLREAWPLFQRDAIHPVIDRVYTLDQIQEAHRYMASNHNIGKIIVQVQPQEV